MPGCPGSSQEHWELSNWLFRCQRGDVCVIRAGSERLHHPLGFQMVGVGPCNNDGLSLCVPFRNTGKRSYCFQVAVFSRPSFCQDVTALSGGLAPLASDQALVRCVPVWFKRTLCQEVSSFPWPLSEGKRVSALLPFCSSPEGISDCKTQLWASCQLMHLVTRGAQRLPCDPSLDWKLSASLLVHPTLRVTAVDDLRPHVSGGSSRPQFKSGWAPVPFAIVDGAPHVGCGLSAQFTRGQFPHLMQRQASYRNFLKGRVVPICTPSALFFQCRPCSNRCAPHRTLPGNTSVRRPSGICQTKLHEATL